MHYRLVEDMRAARALHDKTVQHLRSAEGVAEGVAERDSFAAACAAPGSRVNHVHDMNSKETSSFFGYLLLSPPRGLRVVATKTRRKNKWLPPLGPGEKMALSSSPRNCEWL